MRTLRYDPRIWIALNLISAVAILLIQTEIGVLSLFGLCIAIHLISGQTKYVLTYIIDYIVLLGLSWIGVQLALSDVPTTAVFFSLVGQMGRRMLIPLSYAIILANTPTGAFLEAISKMKLPKAVGIGVAVLLRFFPTIIGEYRMIRNSQKFRGIGVGIFDKIIQLPQIIENTLIPIIMRISKISEELSASITTRGVRFSGEVVSFIDVKFKAKDIILLAVFLICCTAIYIVEVVLGGVI